MPKSVCCKPRYILYPSFFGGLTLVAGSVTSYNMAMKIASTCASGIDSLIGNIGSNFTLSDIDATVHIGRHNFTVNFDDIHGNIPSSLMSVLDELHTLPNYCFVAPLTLGLGISCAISLALASTVAVSLYLCDQNKERLEPNSLEEVVVSGENSSLVVSS